MLTPDEAMMEQALAHGTRITMMATFELTLATATAAMNKIAASRQVRGGERRTRRVRWRRYKW